MRHSKRDYLKTDDVKLSIEKLSIPVSKHILSLLILRTCLATLPRSLTHMRKCQSLPIYGSLSLRYGQYTNSKQNINLKDFVVDQKPKLYTPLSVTTYTTHFEAIDGNPPKIAETVEEKEPLMMAPTVEMAHMNESHMYNLLLYKT